MIEQRTKSALNAREPDKSLQVFWPRFPEPFLRDVASTDHYYPDYGLLSTSTFRIFWDCLTTYNWSQKLQSLLIPRKSAFPGNYSAAGKKKKKGNKQEKLVKVTEKDQRGGKTGKWVSWNLTESLEKFGGIIRCHRNYLVVTGGILNKDTEPDDIYYQGRVWGHRPYPGVHGCYRPGLPALVFVALKGIRRCLPRAKGRHTHGHRGGRIYPWPGPNLYK